jgi:hypothetical protein
MATSTPTPTIDAIKDKKQRREFTRLARERAFYGVTLSINALLAAGLSLDQIRKCVLAWDDGELRKLKEETNSRIAAILTDYGITSLRDIDAFGNAKDYIWMEGGSAQLNSSKLRAELLARKIAPDVVAEIIDAATTRTKYYTLQCRSVKEKDNDDQTTAPVAETRQPAAKAARRGK